MSAGWISFGLTGDTKADYLAVGAMWDTLNITYSFPSAASNYGSGWAAYTPTFSAFNATMQSAVDTIFNEIKEFTNLNPTKITETDSTHADIRFGRSNGLGAGVKGDSSYPGSSQTAGDVWIAGSSDMDTPVKGNFPWLAIMHEIGHSLGLKHGHEAENSRSALPSNKDALEFTVMTYRAYIGGAANPTSGIGSTSYPQTYMTYDIYALQYMYGANYNTRNTDTTYSWNDSTGAFSVNGVTQWTPTANKIYQTIWDGGGSDILDFRSLSQKPSPISLTNGTGSKTGSTQLPSLTVAPTANIYTAFRFGGSSASDIDSYSLYDKFMLLMKP